MILPEVLRAYLPFLTAAGVLLAVAPWVSNQEWNARKFVVVLGWVLVGRYIWWRFANLPSWTWSPFDVASYVLCILEGITIVFFFRTTRVLQKTQSRSAEADEHANWYADRDQPPLVDVFIPTYNENRQILEKTIIGALELDYARKRVWILDDSRRDWLRCLTEQLGAHYLARPSNEHFKAGNLNNAYKHVLNLDDPPDFICVFDADFIPQRRFLKRVLSLMWESTVGIVQTPQHFYNSDPVQLAFGGRELCPDDQRSQFDVRLPAQDVGGRAYCCGTSFLVRVAALKLIGGFPTESISEDTLTTMKLGRYGIETRYLNEALSAGLAAEGIEEFLKQRARWCLGTIQNFKTEWGPLSIGGLKGRLLFLEGCTKWGLPLAVRMVFLTIPCLYWFTGFTVIHGEENDVAYYILPMLLHRGATAWLYGGRQLPIITDAASILAAFVIVPTTFQALMSSKSAVFKVTNKGVNHDKVVVHWALLRWILLLVCLNIGGMLYNLFYPRGWESAHGWHYYWTYYGLLVLLAAALPCIELPRRRREERFATTERGLAELASTRKVVEFIDLSLSGASFVVPPETDATRIERVRIDDVGWVSVRYVRDVAPGRVGVTFDLNREEYYALIRKLHCSGEYLKIVDAYRALPCILTGAKRMVTFRED